MTRPDLDTLETLAKAAMHPGALGYAIEHPTHLFLPEPEPTGVAIAAEDDPPLALFQHRSDAEWFAACNPATILRWVAYTRQLEEELATARTAVGGGKEVPHVR